MIENGKEDAGINLDTLLLCRIWEEAGKMQDSITSPNGWSPSLDTGQRDWNSSVHKATVQLCEGLWLTDLSRIPAGN